MTLTLTALVLLAGLLHATWNALAKTIPDKLVAFGLIGAAVTLVSAVALPVVGLPDRPALWYALGSAAVHVAYELGLMRCYRLGAFGQTYPVARGTAPLLVAAGAWVFAGEHLSALQLAGVATVAVGLLAIVLGSGRLDRADVPALVAAVATGVAIAAYTLIDGLGVRHSANSLGYVAVLFVLQGPILPAVAWWARRSDALHLPPRVLAAGGAAGLLSLLAYGIVIWAQTRGSLAVVSALRETSVVAATVIGAVVFKEPFGRRRIPAAVAVVAGIVLINV